MARYYLSGPEDSYAERGAAPAPVPAPQTTVVQGGAVQAGAFAPMKVISSIANAVQWLAQPGKTASKLVTKTVAKTAVPEEYHAAAEQSVSAFYKTAPGKAVAYAVSAPVEKKAVQIATDVAIRTGIEEAWSKMGESAAVRLLMWLGKGAAKYAKVAGPVASIASDIPVIYEGGSEAYKTYYALPEAARQAVLSKEVAAAAHTRAKAGQDQLRSEHRLLEALPFVIRVLEERRVTLARALRDKTKIIEALRHKQNQLAPQGILLNPADTRLLWDKINEQNMLAQQVWQAADEMARVQAMPPPEKAHWLDDLFAKNPGLKEKAVAADTFH